MDHSGSILLVDDESGIREVYSLLLERAGFRVTAVATAAEAQEMVIKQSFDIVLTDLALEAPLAGLEVIAAARRCTPPIPVILVSAQVTPGILDEVSALSVAVLQKPVDFVTLTQRIRAMLLRREDGSP